MDDFSLECMADAKLLLEDYKTLPEAVEPATVQDYRERFAFSKKDIANIIAEISGELSEKKYYLKKTVAKRYFELKSGAEKMSETAIRHQTLLDTEEEEMAVIETETLLKRLKALYSNLEDLANATASRIKIELREHD